MSAHELAERVQRLAEGLRAQPDLEAAIALRTESQALHDSVQQLQQLDGGEQGRQQLRLALDQCTGVLARLGSQLQTKAHRVSTFRHTMHEAIAAANLLSVVAAQMAAGCHLSAACCALSRLADTPVQDWQRLARSAYSLLHGGGLELLKFSAKCFAASGAGAPAGTPAASMLLAQLHAAAAFARGMPLGQQLEAGPLQPSQLRAWLAAAVQLLILMRQLGQPGEHDVHECILAAAMLHCIGPSASGPIAEQPMPDAWQPTSADALFWPSAPGWVQQPVLPVLPELAAAIYSCQALDASWASEQGRATAQQLVQLLMPAVSALPVALHLPSERRPSGCSLQVAACLFDALARPPMRLAHEAWCRAADSRNLLSVLCGTAQLLAMDIDLTQPAAGGIPPAGGSAGSCAAAGSVAGSACPPGDPSPAALVPGHVLALGALMALRFPARLAAQRAEQHSAQERQRLARGLLPVVARLPRLAALLAGRRPGRAQDSASGEAALAPVAFADACTAAVQLLLSSVSRPAAADAPVSHRQSFPISTLEDVVGWCSAASAAQRSIPAIAHLGAATPALVGSLAELAFVAGMAAAHMADGCRAHGSALVAEAGEHANQLIGAARDLHTRTARLVHFAVAGGCGAALQQFGPESLLSTLSSCMAAAHVAFRAVVSNASSLSGPVESQLDRQLKAMAVMHVPAIHVLAGVVSLSGACNLALRSAAASGLSAAAASGPTALHVSPTLRTLLQQVLQSPFVTALDCHAVFEFCTAAPLLVAHLLRTGCLSSALARAAQACREAEALDLWSAATKCIEAVVKAAAEAGASHRTHNLRGIMHSLTAARDTTRQGSWVEGTAQLAAMAMPELDQLAQFLEQQLTPAPEAAALELAQAAAARSCAYLCCANLGGEGGPAAGQGVGSMRCSACRAVWYCGTACSHADWREGGHRRVCKALGAARAAEKERRRQAAAEGEAPA